MSYIIDGRSVNKNRHLDNRKRFLDRHKDQVKDAIKNKTKRGSIKEFGKSGGYVPHITYDQDGKRTIVLPGNVYNKGDQILKPPLGGNKSGGGGDDDPTEFIYLNKDEIIDFFFEDMELPNLVNKKIKADEKDCFKNCGYSKYGIPPRLHIKKTFEQAVARKIANKREDYKPMFICEEDLRYINRTVVKNPIFKAVMFCIMDISGSMGEMQRDVGYKFFTLLYLFLHKFYKEVDVVFIIYHTKAAEVSEKEFFNTRETGGTISSTALELVKKIIEERYSSRADYNLYSAHVSDGDNFGNDEDKFEKTLSEINPFFQYMSYIEVNTCSYPAPLYKVYSYLARSKKNIGFSLVDRESKVYSALRELFKKKGVDK
jgi:uncharacterized sporulation protein YeaH/YhbH (DUF444 family)